MVKGRVKEGGAAMGGKPRLEHGNKFKKKQAQGGGKQAEDGSDEKKKKKRKPNLRDRIRRRKLMAARTVARAEAGAGTGSKASESIQPAGSGTMEGVHKSPEGSNPKKRKRKNISPMEVKGNEKLKQQRYEKALEPPKTKNKTSQGSKQVINPHPHPHPHPHPPLPKPKIENADKQTKLSVLKSLLHSRAAGTASAPKRNDIQKQEGGAGVRESSPAVSVASSSPSDVNNKNDKLKQTVSSNWLAL
eukprot:766169-Hanusia_phi.AAC.4